MIRIAFVCFVFPAALFCAGGLPSTTEAPKAAPKETPKAPKAAPKKTPKVPKADQASPADCTAADLRTAILETHDVDLIQRFTCHNGHALVSDCDSCVPSTFLLADNKDGEWTVVGSGKLDSTICAEKYAVSQNDCETLFTQLENTDRKLPLSSVHTQGPLNVQGEPQILGVAPNGEAWATRFLLPAAEMYENEACPYPEVDGVAPGSVTLALCKSDATCELFPIYDMLTCTSHDDAAKALTTAKAAWTRAGIPWDQPVPQIARKEEEPWRLPKENLIITQTYVGGIQFWRFEQNQRSGYLYLDDYLGESAMATTYTSRLFYIAASDKLIGFKGGACCGGEYQSTDAIVVDMKALRKAMASHK